MVDIEPYCGLRSCLWGLESRPHVSSGCFRSGSKVVMGSLRENCVHGQATYAGGYIS